MLLPLTPATSATIVATPVLSLGLVLVGREAVISYRLVVVTLEIVIGLGTGWAGRSATVPRSVAYASPATAAVVFFVVFLANAVVVLRGGIVSAAVVAVGYNTFGRIFLCENDKSWPARR